MIKATVREVREAFRALRRINEEVRLPQKAAWRVSRLINLLKPIVRDFEETRVKLFKDAGGVQADGGIRIEDPVREANESLEAWTARKQAHGETVNGLTESVEKLDAEEEEINYAPLPLALFDDDEKTPADKRRMFSANDFADLGQFITE